MWLKEGLPHLMEVKLYFRLYASLAWMKVLPQPLFEELQHKSFDVFKIQCVWLKEVLAHLMVQVLFQVQIIYICFKF